MVNAGLQNCQNTTITKANKQTHLITNKKHTNTTTYIRTRNQKQCHNSKKCNNSIFIQAQLDTLTKRAPEQGAQTIYTP
jgi:hypothetical protein